MSAEYWHKVLTTANVEEVAALVDAFFRESRFCAIEAFSFDSEQEGYSSINVTPSQRLQGDLRVTPAGDTSLYAHIGWTLDRSVMGVMTTTPEPLSSRSDRWKHDWVSIQRDGRTLTVDHYAPAGNRLHWVFALESPAGGDR